MLGVLRADGRKGGVTVTEPRRLPTVVLVGTLDTKGMEYGFLVDRIREQGVSVLVVDAGILGEPLITPDVTRRGGGRGGRRGRAGTRGCPRSR